MEEKNYEVNFLQGYEKIMGINNLSMNVDKVHVEDENGQELVIQEIDSEQGSGQNREVSKSDLQKCVRAGYLDEV